MTRDEAITKLSNRLGNSETWAAHWIDGYEALGMLKLEKPKSLNDKLLEALAREGYAFLKPEALQKSLALSGLKITER